MDLEEIEKILRALIVIKKNGVPLDEINEEFLAETGQDIPYLSLGYFSLYDLMRNIKNIKTARDKEGRVVYVLRNATNLQHIVNLIKKQRDPLSRSKRLPQRKTIMKKKNTNIKSIRRNPLLGIYNSENDDSNQSAESYEEANQTPVEIINPPKNMNQIHTPICNGYQMIGDDFFLQLAIRNLKQPIWRQKALGPLHCGLCVSGMTVRGTLKKLHSVNSLSNKVVIMLGAEDLYRGRAADEIVDDYKKLLDLFHTKFAFSKNAITICTIPPLANIGIHSHPTINYNIQQYNEELRKLAYTQKYGIIDFFNHYTNSNCDVMYDLFQIEARMVSGSSHPYVLLNRRGRQLAVSLLGIFNTFNEWSKI